MPDLPSATTVATSVAPEGDDEHDVDLTGSVLDGRYRVLSRIGAGGMGTVYLVEHVVLGSRMAAKVLKPDAWSNRKAVTRFLQEAKTASQIRHPNTVEITDFGFAETLPFFVMELLEGEDLSAISKREGAIPWPRVREWMLQILAALEAAHAQGVLHRDMKPHNCFLVREAGREPFIKVLDFGLAKLIREDPAHASLTGTGTVVGTPHYMAPEQANAEALDVRADVYAAGVIAFQLLTGRVPFDGSGFLNVFAQLLTRDIPTMASVAPEADVPPAVEAAVRRAMAKNRDDRYASASEFAAAFRELAHAPVVAPPRRRGFMALLLVPVGGALVWALATPGEVVDDDPPRAEARIESVAPPSGGPTPALADAQPTSASPPQPEPSAPAPANEPSRAQPAAAQVNPNTAEKRTKPGKPTAPAELPERPSEAAIQQVFAQAERDTIQCGDKYRAVAPTIDIDVEVSAEGEVVHASADRRLKGSSLTTCVERMATQMSFPASQSGFSRKHTFALHGPP
jgi:serine/threonine-protein kinase